MPVTTCPYGSEIRPEADISRIVSEADLLNLFFFLPPQAVALLLPYFGYAYDQITVCASPSPGYPTWEASDLLDFTVLSAKIKQWMDADNWDDNCQCKTAPGG